MERQFTGLSDYSQLLIADGEIDFSGSIPALFYFCLFVFCFAYGYALEPASSMHTTKRRRKPSSDSHSIYVPQEQQNGLQSILHRAAK